MKLIHLIFSQCTYGIFTTHYTTKFIYFLKELPLYLVVIYDRASFHSSSITRLSARFSITFSLPGWTLNLTPSAPTQTVSRAALDAGEPIAEVPLASLVTEVINGEGELGCYLCKLIPLLGLKNKFYFNNLFFPLTNVT